MLFRQRLASAILAAVGSGVLFIGLSGCSNNKIPAYIPFPNLQQVGLRQVWERQIVLARARLLIMYGGSLIRCM